MQTFLRRLAISLATMSATTLSTAVRLPAQPASRNSAELDARIDSLFSRHVTPNGPGCGVGASRNGEPVFTRGFGTANLDSGDPITAQTAFNIGSVGKQFTALAVLLLEQRGRLSLDEDVRRHVPELPKYGTPIRIRDLLYHTSGLRDYGTLAALGDKPVHTTAEFLSLMSRQRALNFPTGQRHEYSHSDYSLLGVVIERVAGEPLGTFFEREIWAPLSMTSTRLHDDRRRPIHGRALAYDGSSPDYRVIYPTSEIIGGSNVYTTVDDLLRWERNVQTPTVGTRAMFDRMVDRPKLASGQVIPYAYGLWLGRYRGLRTVHRGGGGGGFHTQMLRFPDQRVATFVLCNRPLPATTFAEEVAGLLLSDRMEPMPADSTRDTVATPAVDLATLPGVYRAPETPWNIWQIVAKNGRLHDVVPDTSFPMTRLRNGQYYSDGVFYRFTASGSGKTAHMTFTARDVREELDRAPSSRLWQPQPSTLRAFTGTFYSAESGAIWEIAIDRGVLVLRRPGAADTPLMPVVPGWFFGNLRLPDASTSIGLEFPRGTTSASHFMMTALPNFEIVRNLRFDRVGRP